MLQLITAFIQFQCNWLAALVSHFIMLAAQPSTAVVAINRFNNKSNCLLWNWNYWIMPSSAHRRPPSIAKSNKRRPPDSSAARQMKRRRPESTTALIVESKQYYLTDAPIEYKRTFDLHTFEFETDCHK